MIRTHVSADVKRCYTGRSLGFKDGDGGFGASSLGGGQQTSAVHCHVRADQCGRYLAAAAALRGAVFAKAMVDGGSSS